MNQYLIQIHDYNNLINDTCVYEYECCADESKEALYCCMSAFMEICGGCAPDSIKRIRVTENENVVTDINDKLCTSEEIIKMVHNWKEIFSKIYHNIHATYLGGKIYKES